MKIVVAYDGSPTADAALDDLRFAGIPDNSEVHVISVAEVWLPPENVEQNGNDNETKDYLEKLTEKHRQKGMKEVAEAQTLAHHAGERLRNMFPTWIVKTGATFGSPAWEIITRSNELIADLIVVGSHGRSAVGRLFLGSISQKVLTEAYCSVRVARGRIEVDSMPSRVLIGFDGSAGAYAAVEAVLGRIWQKNSEFKLIVATDALTPTAIGRFVPPVVNWIEYELKTERELLQNLAAPALERFNRAGLSATVEVGAGNAKQVLVEEAERWHSDVIFVGANSYGSRVERYLLGSVSAAVAARASCSVEVVRRREPSDNVA